MRKAVKHTSYRLTPEAYTLLERLTAHLGLTRTGVVETAVRVLAEQEGLRRKGYRPAAPTLQRP